MIGYWSIAQKAIGELPPELDASEVGAFSILLRDPDAQLLYLVEIHPWNDEKVQSMDSGFPIGSVAIGEFELNYVGGLETVYISDHGYHTKGGESPEHTTYMPVTSNPFQFEASILSGDEFRGSSPSVGAVRILNGDSAYDHLANYYFGGRKVSVFAGSEGFTRADFAESFTGFMTQPEFDENEIIVNISDKSNVLETEFVQNLYKGEGGLEGGDDIANTPKPLLYGECNNVSPVLVDPGNLIYQVHDGSIEEVTAVYDKGVALTYGGDVTDITATSVSAGQYKTQLSGGYIKLGSSPTGRVTANVKGDNRGLYVNTTAAIVQRIVTSKMGAKSFSVDDIDQGAFNRFDSAVPAKVGIYIDAATDLKQVLDDLIVSIQGYWTFSRRGKLTVGALQSPTSASFTITDHDIEEGSIEIRRVIAPAWRVSIGYKRSWTLQSEDDFAAAALTDFKTFAKERYRTVTIESGQVRGRTASQTERTFNTFMVDQAEAITEANRIQDIYGKQRKVIRLDVVNLLFRVFIGDVIEVQTDKFCLSGKPFLITAISEDAETGTTQLELWG